MQKPRLFSVLLVAVVAVAGSAATTRAAGPPNPYSGFNLSGINWGSQQWERDQRAGRVVWPYYNVPGRTTYRRSNVTVGGVTGGGGAVIQGGAFRSSPRNVRRWRR